MCIFGAKFWILLWYAYKWVRALTIYLYTFYIAKCDIPTNVNLQRCIHEFIKLKVIGEKIFIHNCKLKMNRLVYFSMNVGSAHIYKVKRWAMIM